MRNILTCIVLEVCLIENTRIEMTNMVRYPNSQTLVPRLIACLSSITDSETALPMIMRPVELYRRLRWLHKLCYGLNQVYIYLHINKVVRGGGGGGIEKQVLFMRLCVRHLVNMLFLSCFRIYDVLLL